MKLNDSYIHTNILTKNITLINFFVTETKFNPNKKNK